MSSPPTKRQRLPRACKTKRKEKDIEQACELLENINFFLIKYSDDDTIKSLLNNITQFLDKYQTKPKEEQKQEPDSPLVGKYVYIELSDHDSWSDELSEHSSDRDFIASSDDEEAGRDDEDEESSYQPSESSDTSQTSQDECSNNSEN